LPEIFADYDQLQQVFLNLFLNARDAMPEGGELLIKTSNSNQEIKMKSPTAASALTREISNKSSTPFFTTKSTGKGNGLGWRFVTESSRRTAEKSKFILTKIEERPFVSCCLLMKKAKLKSSQQAAARSRQLEITGLH
jgi:light-regulated signal transduction histidine kinase (bacteriophytochrome)